MSILEVYKESDDAISIKVQTSFLNKEIKAVATSQEVQTQEPDDSSIKIARAQAIKRKFWSRLTGKVISILAR